MTKRKACGRMFGVLTLSLSSIIKRAFVLYFLITLRLTELLFFRVSIVPYNASSLATVLSLSFSEPRSAYRPLYFACKLRAKTVEARALEEDMVEGADGGKDWQRRTTGRIYFCFVVASRRRWSLCFRGR